ncbi:hypothetical protein L0F51_00085 [Afifella sp. H1R]|uniref:hypothetical protein n=1 Tax=Afifella sp. H1R TaxID=2908841 RepID=UPI001F2F5C70|nr:hypothetical protein [Afifella sp. H1R]MCF1502164.1 hypothetical protein [Afifella sp. H1R]
MTREQVLACLEASKRAAEKSQAEDEASRLTEWAREMRGRAEALDEAIRLVSMLPDDGDRLAATRETA